MKTCLVEFSKIRVQFLNAGRTVNKNESSEKDKVNIKLLEAHRVGQNSHLLLQSRTTDPLICQFQFSFHFEVYCGIWKTSTDRSQVFLLVLMTTLHISRAHLIELSTQQEQNWNSKSPFLTMWHNLNSTKRHRLIEL